MIIRKVKMVNFRGFHDKTIDFLDKSVILLSAANGVGKTTTIDAIEWCLTGDIGRLKNAFDTRSTNDDDRKMNTEGILKNRDAKPAESVKVTLWLFDGNNESILCREQTKDELKAELSKVTIDGKEDEASKFIQEYIGDSFYNYHFCDVQKSFNVQSKKRKDLKDFFGEFITNYDEQKQIAENLEIFADDVDRHIADIENQKIKQEVIEEQTKQSEKIYENSKLISYPQMPFYPEERLKISELSIDELVAQKAVIEKCGYQAAKESLSILVDNETLKKQQEPISKIVYYWETKENIIREALQVSFHKNNDAITTLETRLKKIKNIALSKNTILQDGESVFVLVNGDYSRADFDTAKITIENKAKEIERLSSEIDLLSENNKILKLLSSLSANKQTVLEYRDTIVKENGVARCPVCGSENFADLDEALILKEADDYIKKNGDALKKKEIEKASLQSKLDALYLELTNQIKTIIEKERDTLETRINKLQILKDEIQPYFEEIKTLQNNGVSVDAEKINKDSALEIQRNISDSLLSSSREQEYRESYQKILTVLGYNFENETIQQTYEKIKNLSSSSNKALAFSYTDFINKFNAIDRILANQTLSDLKKKIESEKTKNDALNTEIETLTVIKSKALQKAKDIVGVVESLSKDEYKGVGPALSQFYNKLSRFNSDDGFNIVQENDGISLHDNRGKNIVNILSNGQINVFMLAHFFAGINLRTANEKMKVYFIDDLTACMDDVNMLAFMDLLKYQMSSKATMDQLFFITCDDRISRLLKYKLSGREIEFRELVEADFV